MLLLSGKFSLNLWKTPKMGGKPYLISIKLHCAWVLSVGADHFKMVSALALFLYKMETNSSRQYQTH